MTAAPPLHLAAARPVALAPGAPEVAVILPVWHPDPAHLAAQLASLARQTLPAALVVAVIADATSARLVRRLAAEAGLVVTLVEPGHDLDPPRAVEAGLVAALAATGPGAFYALADQDDIWHPDRLARGAAALGRGAALAHSDARVVDADGALLHTSLSRMERRHPRPGLRGLLLRNAVTGMTATFTRTLAERALPFPAQDGVHFYHDLWLALLAAATGGIARIDAALVDYRQHAANAHGAQDRRRLRLRLPTRAALRAEVAGYALARYLAFAVADRLLREARSGEPAVVTKYLQKDDRNPTENIRLLQPYLGGPGGALRLAGDALRLAATGHLRLSWTAGAHAACHLGRSLWALREGVTAGRRQALAVLDARLWRLAPGVAPPAAPVVPQAPVPLAQVTDNRMVPAFGLRRDAPSPSLHVLVPTVNPAELFAGAATAIEIAAGLAARGVRVNLVATDSPVTSSPATRQMLAARVGGDRRALARLSLFCGQRGGTLAVHPGDRLMATAWWTAHVAHAIIRRADLATHGFHYLIQDDEPQFYPWGAEHAAAEASYALPCRPLFNSLTLQDHFLTRGRPCAGAAAFHPDVALDRFLAVPRQTRPARRLAVYGRPQVPRNLFPLAVQSLAQMLAARGVTPDRVELLSVGLPHAPVDLGGGHVLHSLGKLPLADYPGWLGTVDIGLALMLSPHPGHVALEMAAAGVRTVTNIYENKNLTHLFPAILSAEPEPDALARALSQAWDMPPPTHADRTLDLTRLGPPLRDVLDEMALELLEAGLG